MIMYCGLHRITCSVEYYDYYVYIDIAIGNN